MAKATVQLAVGMKFEHINAGSMREITAIDEAAQVCKVLVAGGYGGTGDREYTPQQVRDFIKRGVWARRDGC